MENTKEAIKNRQRKCFASLGALSGVVVLMGHYLPDASLVHTIRVTLAIVLALIFVLCTVMTQHRLRKIEKGEIR